MFTKDCKAQASLQRAWDKKHPNDARTVVKGYVRVSSGKARFYWIAVRTLDNGQKAWKELGPTIAKARAEILR